jgi:hypothetical protein
MDKAFEAVRDYKWSTTSQAIQRANNASPISSDRYTTTTQE